MANNKKSFGGKNTNNENPFKLTISHFGRPIVVRSFNVDQYNNEVRRSVDLNDIMADLIDIIKDKFKEADYDHMYNEHDLRDNHFSNKYKKEKQAAVNYVYYNKSQA